jgi:hypothetical protein
MTVPALLCSCCFSARRFFTIFRPKVPGASAVTRDMSAEAAMKPEGIDFIVDAVEV